MITGLSLKMKLTHFTLYLLISTLTINNVVLANDKAATPVSDDISWLFELELEELMQIEVSVVNLEKESILNAPAITSRYSTVTLRALGLNTLAEMLSFIPGLVVDLGSVGNKQIMIRGAQESFNNKILMLLDNIPYWSPSHSEHPTNGIPLNSIEFIEVIRGPGPVFYGTNAIGGVINLISYKEQPSSVSFEFGSNNSKLIQLASSKVFDNQSTIQFSASKQSDDGFIGSIIINDQVMNSFRRSQEHQSVSVSYLFNQGVLRFNYFEEENSGARNLQNRGVDPTNESFLYHGSYSWDLAEGYLKIFSDYNQNTTSTPFTYFDKNGRDNYRWRNGLQWLFKPNNSSQFISGVEYETISVGERFSTGRGSLVKVWDAEKVVELALYSQWLKKKQDWTFLLGARYVNNKNFGNNINPRASVVYQLNQLSSLKLLYSTGYTSPNFTQLKVGRPLSTTENTSESVDYQPLKSEIINMLDFAYQYISEHTLFVANIYSYQTENFLTRLPPPTPKYINEKKFRRTGAELDWQYHTKNWRTYLNLSYNAQGNTIKKDDLRSVFVPKSIANLGMRYLSNNHGYGASVNYLSERHIADARYDLKINYQYHWNTLKFSFNVTNLLATEQQAPDIGFFSLDHPNEVKDDKRSVHFRLSWVFN